MLNGIHPLLTGDLLAVLDEMGHGDTLLLADAHFPAARLGRRVLAAAGVGVPALAAAIGTVLPLEEALPAAGMADDGPDAAPGGRLPIHDDLEAATGLAAGSLRLLGRDALYTHAADAFAVVRTGETRAFGNLLLRKGLAVPLSV
ncbi:transport protein RbsD/FucU [Leifsonia sp. ku-ls]|nr:transport protein RbsD/FucU [Leifsonia sp. ku-ls]